MTPKFKITPKKIFYVLISLLIAFVIFYIYIILSTTPSNNKDWTTDQEKLSEIDIDTTTVHIENIKDFSYGENENIKIPNFYNATYTTDKIKDIWYFQNDFEEPLGAHSFLTFEFSDGQKISASVEIRKEEGESYDPFLALFNKFELHYMLVSERDILTLRGALRAPPVYMYKLKLSKEEKKALFLAWLNKAQEVNANPEFYNTLTNACTTNIVDNLDKVLNNKISFDLRTIFPKYSDKMLYDYNLLDTGLTWEELKQSSKINDEIIEAYKISSTTISDFIRQKYESNASM